MIKDEGNLKNLRHSLAHALAAAVLEVYPNAKPAIGPAIENGFYYDFDFGDEPLSESDLPKLEKKMRDILKTWGAFESEEVSKDDAKKRFSENPYKFELIDEITDRSETLTLYTAGSFTDLCRGGHVDSAKEIDADAFALDRVAGAYWRGDENNKMLTRIYGLAFATKAELDDYRAMQEEAKKRDHRKLGKELGLFTFSDLVGPGLPLFTPKGTVLREEINTYSQQLRKDRGYQKTWIPHITKTDLYKTSGHWDKFGHELFMVKSQETGEDFVLKPMNCPHHTQIYASQPHSYRDLPIRFMETTTVYRDEKSGEMSGLSRVRSITQDDTHVFCTIDQVGDEYASIMEMVAEFYQTLGMPFRARLSFRDPNDTEQYLGGDELWEQAQAMLENIAKNGNFEYFITEDDAAFYGPKIDFLATDALGREHQLATAQLDFVQPERFELEYTDADGSKKTPVIIHLAIAGSLERFLSVYIEHTAGAFPLWLSPVQVKVLPISDDHRNYAATVAERLKEADIRIELDESAETLGKKVREAKSSKVPYFVVIGDQEMETKTIAIESRDAGKLEKMTIDLFLRRIREEIMTRKGKSESE